MFLRVFILTAIPLLAVYLFEQLRQYRKRHASWPQLKSSLLWGHLKEINNFITKGEPRRHIDKVLLEINDHLGNPPLYVLDLWPVQNWPLAIICSHEVAEQVSRSSKRWPYSITKTPTLAEVEPLLGRHSIIIAEGEEWKSLRKRFNPGFAPQHLMAFLPCILEKAWPFLNHLEKYVQSGDEFQLAELCHNLTFDIIGAVTMDEDLHAQLDKVYQNEIVKLYRELAFSYRSGSSVRWRAANPLTALRRWKISRRLDDLIKDHIKRKFAGLKEQSQVDSKSNRKSRSVLALSLQDTDKLDSHVLDQTCDQLKTFLFAGHDTTSILLQWTFYELGRTPRALNALRRELDDIFGPDPSPAVVRDMLLSPHGEDLIKKMSYTSAVIKEILRLYPSSGTARYVPPGTGFNVQLPDGKSVCLDGLVIYNCQTIIQRDGAVYGPTKDEFMPERWLGDSDTSMATNTDEKPSRGRVPPSAWRPFERGPRNCIGQELANIEVRVILACSMRRYEFIKVGLGEVARDSAGEPIVNARGQYEVKLPLFNTRQVTGRPVDGTMMKVQLAPGAKVNL